MKKFAKEDKIIKPIHKDTKGFCTSRKEFVGPNIDVLNKRRTSNPSKILVAQGKGYEKNMLKQSISQKVMNTNPSNVISVIKPNPGICLKPIPKTIDKK